mmetsp:Transcript_11157/g.30847  ORF Transcript_11157/g.30847 Transcript_11157/m.30847 type:complete len:116 (-) Transcript_11157:231-578(-)
MTLLWWCLSSITMVPVKATQKPVLHEVLELVVSRRVAPLRDARHAEPEFADSLVRGGPRTLCNVSVSRPSKYFVLLVWQCLMSTRLVRVPRVRDFVPGQLSCRCFGGASKESLLS